ncbi:ABC transporter substrate-binding protein [Petroclostridium sp. X23]|uniref:ABC transporter substrate-binding protein n=1 Tax=Petroclostridium sp. X23 TaxID=3045146 RepID=UPI0024ADDA9A|nr:ABC transporter substrate-binding protein [Petroclostridium sp. X23]WHH56832.1 ABC transporter substrate-binding protein [Petroclostridium sp. X23]
MKLKKMVAVLLTMAMVIGLMSGCGSKKQTAEPEEGAKKTEAAEGTETAKGKEEKPYIAMIALGYGHQFWQAVKSGAEKAAGDYGVRITFEGPEQETMVDKQVDMLKTALGNNPVAVCMAAIDTESVAGILQEAKGKGIHVVGFDAGVGKEESEAKCSTDSLAAGALAAENVARILGEKGTIGVIGHSQTVIDAVQRVEGFKEKIKSDYPNIKIADIQYGEGDHLKSAEVAKSMVAANPDIQLIYTSNEGACVGAYNGLKEAGKLDKVKLVGFDSSAAMKAAVKSGEIVGGITQDPIGMGYKAVESAVKLMNGEKVESFIDTGCYWYDSSNMNDEKIAPLLYD